MTQNLIWIGLIAVTALFGWLAANRASKAAFARGRREAELEAAPLRERSVGAESRLKETIQKLEDAQTQISGLSRDKAVLENKAVQLEKTESELASLREKADSDGRLLSAAQAELKQIRESQPKAFETMRLEFSNIAEQLLKEKGADFTKQNQTNLENILNPLRDRIKEFKDQVADTQKDGLAQHIQLKAQIEGLLGMNKQLSVEAQNLTTALKGENKTSGNWGEIVLERVLEMSGLEKGREYEVQQAYTNDEGKRKLPDAIVHLPEQRNLVVDSKLSLVAYERYCSAESPEIASVELQAHIASVRQHVRNLADQRYQDLPGLRTPDFVFLFMPVEPAFIVAVKQDSSLFQEAFDRNIIIVSPSTLLATLRTVANIWKQEYRHRNVDAIAKQAGDLYDKFVGFLESLEGVGDGLTKAQKNFDEAKNRLKDGAGNLIGRVEKLKVMGAKTKKQIPPMWRDGVEDLADEGPSLSLDEPRE
jgi:DNA recombination protein RmuC